MADVINDNHMLCIDNVQSVNVLATRHATRYRYRRRQPDRHAAQTTM